MRIAEQRVSGKVRLVSTNRRRVILVVSTKRYRAVKGTDSCGTETLMPRELSSHSAYVIADHHPESATASAVASECSDRTLRDETSSTRVTTDTEDDDKGRARWR